MQPIINTRGISNHEANSIFIFIIAISMISYTVRKVEQVRQQNNETWFLALNYVSIINNIVMAFPMATCT